MLECETTDLATRAMSGDQPPQAGQSTVDARSGYKPSAWCLHLALLVLSNRCVGRISWRRALTRATAILLLVAHSYVPSMASSQRIDKIDEVLISSLSADLQHLIKSLDAGAVRAKQATMDVIDGTIIITRIETNLCLRTGLCETIVLFPNCTPILFKALEPFDVIRLPNGGLSTILIFSHENTTLFLRAQGGFTEILFKVEEK